MWFFGLMTPPEITPGQIKHLIDNWGQHSCQDDFLSDLCYGGIPLCYRGALWSLLAGNSLQITPELYSIFKKRALSVFDKDQSSDSPSGASDVASTLSSDLESGTMHGKEESMTIIQHDIPRTFPEIEDFHNGSPLAKNLEVILQAYASYRPDVGYVQGMSYLAAMLVYYLDEFNAFKCLANMLARRMSFDYYLLKDDLIHQYTSTFDFFFKLHLPYLHEHFCAESVSSAIFLMDWTMTIFSKALPVDVAARLWDVFLLEGEIFVVRASIGILKLHQNFLLSQDMDKIVRFLKRLPPGSTCPDELLLQTRGISISKDAYDTIMMRFKIQPCALSATRQRANSIASSTYSFLSHDSTGDDIPPSSSILGTLCPRLGFN